MYLVRPLKKTPTEVPRKGVDEYWPRGEGFTLRKFLKVFLLENKQSAQLSALPVSSAVFTDLNDVDTFEGDDEEPVFTDIPALAGRNACAGLSSASVGHGPDGSAPAEPAAPVNSTYNTVDVQCAGAIEPMLPVLAISLGVTNVV